MSGSKVDKPNLTHTLCFMFSGKAGVGKSFTSDYAQKLCDEAGLSTFKAPLAYFVKETALFMGWDGKKDIQGRRLLQSIGTAGRAYDKDLWVGACFNRIENQTGYPFDAIFIDDFRYNNEYNYVVDTQMLYKAIPIRVQAPSREILVGTPEYNDSSETELDDFNFPPMNYVWNEPDYLYYRGCVEDIVYRSFVQYSI